MRTEGGGIKRQGRRARYVTVRPCEWALRSTEVGAAAGNLDLTPTPKKNFIAARSVICSSTSGEMKGHYRCSKTPA